MKALFLSIVAALVAAPSPPARLTKEQIVLGLTKRRSDLDRFRATYTYRAVDARNNLIQEKKMRFARDASKRLSDVEILNPGRPSFRLKAAYDGNVSRQLSAIGHGTISALKASVTDGYDNLCMSFHVPFSNQTLASELEPGQTYFLPRGVDQERYLVLPEQQQVGDRWAHVLWVRDPEKIFDAYWIDPELDFAILKTELRNKDAVATRTIFEDHRPAGDCIVPRRIVTESYGRKDREWTITITIEEIFVGEIPAETFELIFPPGTLVADQTNGRAYQVPGPSGADFDQLSEQAKEEIISFQRRMQQPPSSRGRWTLWLGLPLGLGLGVIIFLIFWRLRR